MTNLKSDLLSQGQPAGAQSGFQGMASARHGQKDARARHEALVGQLRDALKAQGLSAADGKKLDSLVKSPDGEFFWQEILALGRDFNRKQQPEKAGTVFYFLVQAAPEAQRPGAQRELDAVMGQGNAGLRAEFLVSSFVQNATDYRSVVPMLAGSLVGSTISTAALGRLATARSAGLLTRGFGARSLAGLIGLSMEVPVFAFANRALAGSASPVGDDLTRAALTLGALKVFGAAGNRALASQWLAGTPAGGALARSLVPQVSIFAGMLGAHWLEQKAGLRPHGDGATTLTDTLASMVSLSVGAHLGHSLLGPKFAAFQRELAFRVENADSGRESGTPSFLENGRGLRSEALLGPGKIPAATKPSASLRPPALNQIVAMMTTGGSGGKPASGSESGAAPVVWKDKSVYHGLALEWEATAAAATPHLERTVEGMKDGLLDILYNGEEDGVMLAGKVAEQLRNDPNLRAMVNRTGNRAAVKLDADGRRILELVVQNDSGLKLELRDPAFVAALAAPVEAPRVPVSEIRFAAAEEFPANRDEPASQPPATAETAPMPLAESAPLDSGERDCGILSTDPVSSPTPTGDRLPPAARNLPAASPIVVRPATWEAVTARAAALQTQVNLKLAGPKAVSARHHLKKLTERTEEDLNLSGIHLLMSRWEEAIETGDARNFGVIRAEFLKQAAEKYPEVLRSESKTPPPPASTLKGAAGPAASVPTPPAPLPNREAARGKEDYRQQFAIGDILERMGSEGAEWVPVRNHAMLLYGRLNRAVVSAAQHLERDRAGNTLHLILLSRQRNLSQAQMQELLTAFEQALNGKISQEDVRKIRERMVADTWKKLAEISAASALPEEADSQEQNPFPATVPTRPPESAEQLGIKKLNFLSQKHRAWRQVYFETQALHDRLFTPEEANLTPAQSEARDRFPDILLELMEVMEENGRVTPPKVMRLLEAFEKAMDGEISWSQFDAFDFRASAPPASPAEAVPPPAAKPVKGEAPEKVPAEAAKPAPAREPTQRFDPVAQMSPIQEGLWNVLFRTPAEMQGHAIIDAFQAETKLQPVPVAWTLYSNLTRMAGKGFLTYRTEPNPQSTSLPHFKYYSIPETVRRTIGLTAGQKRVMEYFLTAERTEFQAGPVIEHLKAENAPVTDWRGVYRILDSLEGKKLLVSRTEANEHKGLPDRRYYRLPEVRLPGEVPTPSVYRSIVVPENVAEKLAGAPLQNLIYRILVHVGEEMQVSVIATQVRASGEWQGKPESTSLALRVMQKKGLVTSRQAPNPLAGFPELRFYRLPADEVSSEDPSRLHYATWDHVRQRAGVLSQREIEGRLEGRRLNQAREALALLFRYEKDLAPEQGEFLLNALENDFSSGTHLSSVRQLLDKMLPFKKVLHKLKRLNGMGDPWREVATEAGARFNALFHPLVGNSRREAGVRALRELLSTVGQVAPADLLKLLQDGAVERAMEAAPQSPVPPAPVPPSEAPPAPQSVPMLQHILPSWDLTIQPTLEQVKALLQDPRLASAPSLVELGEFFAREISDSHTAQNVATISDQFEWAQTLLGLLNQAVLNGEKDYPAVEAGLIQIGLEIRARRLLLAGKKLPSQPPSEIPPEAISSPEALPALNADPETAPRIGEGPEAEVAMTISGGTPALAETPEGSVAARIPSTPAPAEPETSGKVDNAPAENKPAPVAERSATLNPPRPAPEQERVELVRESGAGKGLFGVGRAFSFFTVPKGNAAEGRAFEAVLVLPNMQRLVLSLTADSKGEVNLLSGKGTGLNSQGRHVFNFGVEKVEGYSGLMRVSLGKNWPPFDLQINPYRDRSNNIQRLELAPIQPEFAADVRALFPAHAPRVADPQVLHFEVLGIKSRSKEYQARTAFYFSNGDRLELNFAYSIRGNGRFQVESANLFRLGGDPETPLSLEILRGGGTGGKNRIILADRNKDFHLEMDAEIPSASAGGSQPLFKNYELKAALPPVWLRLRSEAGQAEQEISPADEASESLEAQSDRISSVPPSTPSTYDEIQRLSLDSMGGNLESVAALGRLSVQEPLALRELMELYDIAHSEGATAEELGGIDPAAYRASVLAAVATAAKDNPRAFVHLTALHSAGNRESIDPLFSVADGMSTQALEARKHLLSRASFGDMPVLEGLERAAQSAGHGPWREEARRTLQYFRIGDAKNGNSLRYKMMFDPAALAVMQILASRNNEAAKEALRTWNDFRGYEKLLAQSEGGEGLREALREVARVNPRAAKFLRDQETAPVSAPQSPVPPSPPPAATATPERVPSKVEAVPVALPPTEPSGPVPAARARLAVEQAHSANMKKVLRRDLFNQLIALAPSLSPEERAELVKTWTPLFLAAVRERHERKLCIFLDALQALDRYLDSETHAWLAEQLRPLAVYIPRALEDSYRSILSGQQISATFVPEAEEAVDPDVALPFREGEPEALVGLKRTMKFIHSSRNDREIEKLYLQVDASVSRLKPEELNALTDESVREFILTAEQSMLPQNRDGTQPNYKFKSKFSVIANVLHRMLVRMSGEEASPYLLVLMASKALRPFHIPWLLSPR